MRTGKMTETINIYTSSKTTNSLGEIIKTNVLHVKVRAEVVYKTGNEIESDGQLTPMQTVIFNIRYNPSIKEDMSIEHNGKFYNIRFINPIDKTVTSILTTKSK